MMKVAIVHDWLVTFGGAERVVEQFYKLYPNADIFTLVYDKSKMEQYFPPEKVHTSNLQKIPGIFKLYTKMLSFMPKAFESFDFTGYDLILCSSSSCAKGVITPPGAIHIAYIHSPMRYAWDLYHDYKKRSGKLVRFFMEKQMPSIRLWDYVSSQRVDVLLANSNYIARRIKKFWNRDSLVVYPPVDIARLTPIDNPSADYYVVFSRMVPYKRIDLAISACKKLDKKLVVIGSGSQEAELKQLAGAAKDIIFTGRISDEEVAHYLQNCKALIFCAEEDFGIIPLEAQACGRPVIAYGKGGSLETVVEGKTGIFFAKQEVEEVITAITTFEELYNAGSFDATAIRKHSEMFSEERFLNEIKTIIDNVKKDFT